MILLVAFAFVAGVVTILSPCILPVLPVVLSGTVGGRSRPLGIVTGFVLSFTFFTLFLSTLVKVFGIPSDFLRTFSIVVIFLFGLALILPGFQEFAERIFSKLPQLPSAGRNGFLGGLIIGLGLGLLWTPCVGPILASVISLALTGSVDGSAFFITLAYALGTALPMLAIMYWGRSLVSRIPRPDLIQKIFGIVMVLTAVGLYFNLDRRLPSFSSNFINFEKLPVVQNQLDKLKPRSQNNSMNAPELIPGGLWFNSPPLTLAQLQGKVVLVDFWTYTCINCIRTLPYLKSWHEKYTEKGLVIIGVHTPEFEFEKEAVNVKKAIADFGLKYPVMQDNDYATWNAYANHYWPAEYLIDKNGKIVHTHFGEGDYDESEKAIQQALAVDMPISNPVYQITARTPELYLGNARRVPGYFTVSGPWSYTDEFAQPGAGASLTLEFNAKDAFLVMSPRGNPGRVKIFLDNREKNTITVDSDKLYDLIRLSEPGNHTLRLEFLDSNLNLYAFTFG